MKETELAKHIIKYLELIGYITYKEVKSLINNKTADIVAIKGNKTLIVECKISPSLAVIEQAYAWEGYSDYICVATLRKGNYHVLSSILNKYQIGYMTLPKEIYGDKNNIKIVNKPAKKKIIDSLDIKNSIHEINKTLIAGSQGGSKYWSPFKQTVQNLENYIIDNPGVSIKAVVDNIEHHYSNKSSAISAIYQRICDGVIVNIKMKRKTGIMRLYYVKADSCS